MYKSLDNWNQVYFLGVGRRSFLKFQGEIIQQENEAKFFLGEASTMHMAVSLINLWKNQLDHDFRFIQILFWLSVTAMIKMFVISVLVHTSVHIGTHYILSFPLEKIFFAHNNFCVPRISFSFVCVNIPARSSFVLKSQFCIFTTHYRNHGLTSARKGDGVRS